MFFKNTRECNGNGNSAQTHFKKPLVSNCSLTHISSNKSTVCPKSSDPILCSNLLDKMGHYFLDIQYLFFSDYSEPLSVLLHNNFLK